MKLTFKMIITLSIITMCSAAVLSGINKWAQPRIKQHAQDARQEAIFSLHPEATDSTQLTEYGEENLPIYSALDKNDRVVGYTFVAAGTGYQGEIRMMVGLKKSLDELAGLVILKQVETPGLGARIEEKAEDPAKKEDYKFRNWFEGLKTTPKIEYVRSKTPQAENQIQAITGATISSASVVEIINNAHPRVTEVISGLKNGGENTNNE